MNLFITESIESRLLLPREGIFGQKFQDQGNQKPQSGS